MAWITAVYNRASAETRTTATDMNRIANNMAELGGNPIKTNYTSADIVLVNEWTAILDFIRPHNDRINESTRFDNLNLIELMMKRLHDGNTWGDVSALTWREVRHTTWSETLGGE